MLNIKSLNTQLANNSSSGDQSQKSTFSFIYSVGKDSMKPQNTENYI